MSPEQKQELLAIWESSTLTMADLGRRYGVSRERVRQIVHLALTRGEVTRTPRPTGRRPSRVRGDGNVWCPRCGDYLPPAKFSRDRRNTIGYGSYCKRHSRQYR